MSPRPFATRRRSVRLPSVLLALTLTACGAGPATTIPVAPPPSVAMTPQTVGTLLGSPVATANSPSATPTVAPGTANSSSAAGTESPQASTPQSSANSGSPSRASASALKSTAQSPAKASATSPVPVTTAAPNAGSQLVVTDADRKLAADLVGRRTLTELAGSVIMPIASQADGTIDTQRYGGVILMGADGVVDGTGSGTPDRVKALVDDLQGQRADGELPLLIGVDQEYGLVARLVNGFTRFPGASTIAANGDPQLARQVAKAAATEMRAVGVSVDFAPDADVLPAQGESSIGDRSYGSNPQRVGEFVAAAVTGLQEGGIAATIKHFPGIGSLATDSHTELSPLTSDCPTWSATDAVPMRAGREAGVALAMTGHVHFPAVGADGPPASLSSRIVTDLLRGKGYGGCVGIEFSGVTVTDSLQMAPIANNYTSGEAAWRAVAAGQDLVLMPIDPQAAVTGLVSAVESGDLPRARLIEAATDVMALRIATARIPQPPLSVIASDNHQQLAARAGGG